MAGWRVYEPQWVTEYVSDALGEDAWPEIQEYVRIQWEGRVRQEDIRLSRADDGRLMVQVYRPVMLSEWKSEPPARPGTVVVAAFSAEEAELRDYGKRKLRT